MAQQRIHSTRLQMVLWCLLAGMLCAATSLTAQDSYAITNLGALRGGSGNPRAVNASGMVVGRSGDPHGSMSAAFLWTPHSGIQSLGTLGGGDYSQALGINDAGQVVGYSNTASQLRGFVWSSAKGLTALAPLSGDSDSEAFGINAAGLIAGSSSGAEGTRGVLWSAAGAPQDLGLGTPSEAVGLNDAGHVVGDRGEGDSASAFFMNGTGAAQDMGALPGYTACRALMLNNADQAVGECNGEQGTQGFTWSSAGGMTGLGLLPGGDFSSASGINKDGVVVGSSGSSLGTHAIVWTPALGMEDLNGLIPAHPEVVLSGAVGINDSGQIIAFGTIGNGANHKMRVDLDHDSHAGPLHMFLLTPITSSAPR